MMMAIRQSGSDGLSRVEVGRVIGLNAGVKSGGRRVSNYIVAAQKAYPQLIDHYQQMDGRQRMFKSVYYIFNHFWMNAVGRVIFCSVIKLYGNKSFQSEIILF